MSEKVQLFLIKWPVRETLPLLCIYFKDHNKMNNNYFVTQAYMCTSFTYMLKRFDSVQATFPLNMKIIKNN